MTNAQASKKPKFYQNETIRIRQHISKNATPLDEIEKNRNDSKFLTTENTKN